MMRAPAVRLVRTAKLTDIAPYAYASVADVAKRLVFTAGACPLDNDGNVVARDDVAGQASAVMDNLETALEAAGASLHAVAKTTVYVASADRTDLVSAWDVVAERFGTHDVPSTLLGVAMLGYAGQLVEVEAIAVID